ncbi:glutamate receptor 2.7-like [Sesamum indicum]|uniref:Glutamate receptor n=1 Tax=Sesamum indicum TaxID=4182 RepID=A0A6I9TBY9_SESIN|nr:glutamate receptor 2.7-like [Sesamum indicum]
MEKKYSSHFIFQLLFFFLYIKILTLEMAAARTQPVPIRVGLVLDMNDYIGDMGSNCISMALSDFYATNAHYKTRLQIHSRDSNGDAVGAAAAVLDLLKNVEVQAILGPLTSVQANFMINLGDKAQVPVITFSATSPSLSSLRSPYFIRATLNDSSQVEAISAVIQAFGWREVVPIYVDNEFGEGIIPFLTDALEQVNARVPYRSAIPSLATDDQIVAELYKLMTMQTRVFIVHMLTNLGSRLFKKAKQLGMMSEDYAWIITDGIANELYSMDPLVVESMLGVIGVKPHISRTKEFDSFTVRYKKRLHQNTPTAISPDLNIFGLWAYDSAIALAIAAEKARLTNASYQRTVISTNSTDLEAFGVSRTGLKLIQVLSSTSFRGLAGKFLLVDGQLQSPPYEIVNVVGPGARVIGYWTKENGISKKLNIRNSNAAMKSRSNFGSIIWPGDKTSPPKGWVIPTNGKKMRIGVPINDCFTEFVHVTWNLDNSIEVEGYCIDVFDAVMAALPYTVPYEYIPFATPEHKYAGTNNDLAYQVYLGNYDAVAGDVTIIANRSQFVDFTLPFIASGVLMVVPVKDYKSKNAWVFLKPLTWELWLTSFCSFVFIGFLIWILEHRINEDFRGPPGPQLGVILWFAFSIMVFAHKEKVVSNLARFVLVIWFLVVLILTQSYTASLASMLTVQQLQPTLTDVNELIRNKEYVGYQEGSFVYGLLKRLNFDESRLLPYNSPEQWDELFSKGTGNGGIAAAFEEIPYINVFLAKYCSKYTTVGPTYKTDGFAFVFPIGSPLVPDVSRAILNITEGEKMVEIEKKWFGNNAKCTNSVNLLSSESLGLDSFWGLFMIVGITAVSALMIHVIRFLHDHWHVIVDSSPDSTISSKIKELLQRFDNRDLSAHTFRKDRNGGDGEAVERAMESHENIQHRPSSFSGASPLTDGPASAVFSDYSEQNISFRREQGSSVGTVIRNSQGEASQVTAES